MSKLVDDIICGNILFRGSFSRTIADFLSVVMEYDSRIVLLTYILQFFDRSPYWWRIRPGVTCEYSYVSILISCFLLFGGQIKFWFTHFSIAVLVFVSIFVRVLLCLKIFIYSSADIGCTVSTKCIP